MSKSDTIDRGREAFQRGKWAEARSLFSAAEKEAPLEPEDLERLAKASYLVGKYSECIEFWTRAHNRFRDRGEANRAAYSAFWLGMTLFNRGDKAQGSGWMARARRRVNEHDGECVVQGFLLVPEALNHLRKGEADRAYELCRRSGEIAERFNDADLSALALLGRGQSLIRKNDISGGISLLDETMVAVVSGEVSPIVSGIVYCAVIEACQKIYDLRRAQEWTEALSRWCDSQPDLIPYRGQCLVRRAEVMQLHGSWPDAMDEVQRACELLDNEPAVGEAFYRQAELHRLQGSFSEAEEGYSRASKWGRKPQPGLALLRLAQGRLDAAVVAIRRLEEETQERVPRSGILPAYVEIMIQAGRIQDAQSGIGELYEIAEELHTPFLTAIADRERGSLLMKEGDPAAALDKLRDACSILHGMEASYETARTRELIGRACRELADRDTAELELDAARWMYQKLGAAHDLSRVESLIRQTASPPGREHGLTPRELEVLRLVATGKTNKAIASELFISERTVDRHVSNILSKLDLPSRSAATAYAYKFDLI